VLRLKVTLRGERAVAVDPVIGYGHRAHEKMAENRTYAQFLPNNSRQDYLSGVIYNQAWCEAVEKLAKIEVPERALVARVILAEYNRLTSHLLWLGSFLHDLGAVTPLVYCFDDREAILDLLESVTGSRLTYCHSRFGGLARDLDADFPNRARVVNAKLKRRWPEFEDLIDGNPIFLERARGVGVFTLEQCQSYGITGPSLRAAGIPYDVRRVEPYGAYPRFEFEIPTATESDSLARYHVRCREMVQSVHIIEQALDALPGGPIITTPGLGSKKKLKPPVGTIYHAVESPRGQHGILIVSEGEPQPYRAKFRTPSYHNMQLMVEAMPQHFIADIIAILGSIDIIVPEIDR
jgi:NADH-quinone oxidoreductase subunit D